VRGTAEGRFGYLVEDRLPGASRFNIWYRELVILPRR